MKTECKICGKKLSKKHGLEDLNSGKLYCSFECFLNEDCELNKTGGK